MTFSYTQISQFLACPRRYRYQYLEGWQEKELRASMLFGRAFEKAVAAYFLGQDGGDQLHREWSAVREMKEVNYGRDSWGNMLQDGTKLLELFANQNRVRILEPERHLQIKVQRRLDARNDFLGFVAALGQLDGQRCLIDWKTTSSCYPENPSGLTALDPQLICYSWLTGISEVALVVFVRKRLPEIQYLKATITETQRQDFFQMVRAAVAQIERAEFFPHPGIRFPQNQCTSCPFAGLCLEDQALAGQALKRREGVNLGWLDELCA